MIDSGNLLAEIGIAQTVSPYSPTENIADKQQQGKYATKKENSNQQSDFIPQKRAIENKQQEIIA